jgi:hypothetical protein
MIIYVIISLLPLASLYITILKYSKVKTIKTQSCNSNKFFTLYISICRNNINARNVCVVLLYVTTIQILYANLDFILVYLEQYFPNLENKVVLIKQHYYDLIVAITIFARAVKLDVWLNYKLNITYNNTENPNIPNNTEQGGVNNGNNGNNNNDNSFFVSQDDNSDSQDNEDSIQFSTSNICSANSGINIGAGIIHQTNSDYCMHGLQKIQAKASQSNMPLDKLLKEMKSKNVTCYHLFNTMKMDKGYLVYDKFPLSIDQPNFMPEVYELAKKIAKLISLEVIKLTPSIQVNHNCFNRITDVNPNIKLHDIAKSLSEDDKTLLGRIVRINRGYYRQTKLEDDLVSLDSTIFSKQTGFKWVNLVNQLGLTKAVSMNTAREKGLELPGKGISAQSTELLNTKLGFKSSVKLHAPIIDHRLQKNNTILHFTIHGRDLKSDINNHNHDEQFSPLALDEIRKASLKYNLSYDHALEKCKKSFSCKELYFKLPTDNGLILTEVNKLNLENPNHNREVYLLAHKAAIIYSNPILNRNCSITFKDGSYGGLLHQNRKVIYNEIVNEFTQQEKHLFFLCVSTNPSHYKHIILDPVNNEIQGDSIIAAQNAGYKTFNTINELGLAKYHAYTQKQKMLHKSRNNQLLEKNYPPPIVINQMLPAKNVNHLHLVRKTL